MKFVAKLQKELESFDAGFAEKVGAIGGVTSHDQLRNRDLPDQHPTSAITGLDEALDKVKIEVGTKAYWDARRLYVPEAGKLIVYKDAVTLPDGSLMSKLKIGDGRAYVTDLPFSDADAMSKLSAHIGDQRLHVSEAERSKWNDKVTCYETYDPETAEVSLIFTKS